MCLWVGSVYVAGCWAGGITGTAVFKVTRVGHPLGNWGRDLTPAHVSAKCIGSSGGGVCPGLKDGFLYPQTPDWSDLNRG